MKKKLLSAVVAALAAMQTSAQTMNVCLGNVTYAFPAEQTGDMPFAQASQLTIGGRTFNLSDVTGIHIDESTITDNTVSVAYNGTEAQVVIAGNVAPYVDATVRGAHVTLMQADGLTEEITYTLTGSSTDGSLYMDGSLKASFVLDALTLHNPDSAAINIRDGKRISVQLADGTTSTLSDGAGGSQKACFMVKGHTEFKGAGTLNIAGRTGHAFWGKEYVELKKTTGTINITEAVGDGMNINQYFQMKGGTVSISGVGDDGISVATTDDATDELNGQVQISGGALTINVSAAAAKGLKCDSLLTLSGGTINITTTGGGAYDSTEMDAKGSACIKSGYAIVIDGGDITLKSTGAGGKGLKCSGSQTETIQISQRKSITICHDGTITVNGGTVHVTTTGSTYKYNSSTTAQPKGIKSDGDLIINGGTIVVTTSGHEGIESKSQMYINDGIVEVTSYDDAINSAYHMHLAGGYIFAKASNNDGLDANGNLYISGGTVVAYGSTSPECGIDSNEEDGFSLYITGGTVLGIGGGTSSPSSTTGSQAVVSFSLSSLSKIALKDQSGNLVLAWDNTQVAQTGDAVALMAPPGGGGGQGGNNKTTVLISTPDMAAGDKYNYFTGVTMTNGTYFHGLTTDASVSTSGTGTSVTASVSVSGGGSGPGGGGGWW